MARPALLLLALAGAALARPGPPASQQEFEQLVRSSLAELSSMRTNLSPKVERSAIDAFVDHVQDGPEIKSARLIGQAVVGDGQPLQAITSDNLALPSSFTDDEESLLLQLLQPTNIIRNHQLTETNAQETSAANIHRAPLLSSGGRSSGGHTGSIGVPLPMVDAQGNTHASSSSIQTGGAGVPLPSFSNQGLQQTSAFGVPLSAAAGQAQHNAGSFGVPLPNLSGQGQGANVGVDLPSSSSQSGSSQSSTVGDLVLDLDGLDGIRVFSLNDLQNSGALSGNSDDNILQQLQNAMISGNIKLDQEPQNVGVDLPSLTLQQNIDEANNFGTEDELNLGRQVGTEAGGDQGFSAIDEIFANNDAAIAADSASGPADTVPIADAAAAAAGTDTDTAADPFATDYSDPFELTDNDDFNYEYDDIEPLPAQPPNVFRSKLSDIFFTKGQWIGTLLGGVIDIGSSISDGVSKLFGKESAETTDVDDIVDA